MKKRELTGIENRKNVSADIRKGYVDTLKKMVNCKTVFTDNFENQSEFDKFYKVIKECFPNLCATSVNRLASVPAVSKKGATITSGKFSFITSSKM